MAALTGNSISLRVQLLDLALQQFLQGDFILIRQFLRLQLDLELEVRPVGQRHQTPVGFEKMAAFLQVDLLNGLLGFANQILGEVVLADLLELTVSRLQAPAGVDGGRQRLPVPLLGVLVAEVLLEHFLNLRGDAAAGPIEGEDHRLVVVVVLEVTRSEFHPQPIGSELRERCRTVAVVQVAQQGRVELLVNHVQDAHLAVGVIKDLLTVAVDALALRVHHLVVLEQVLAGVEVVLLDFLLGLLNLPRDHARSQWPCPLPCPGRSARP